MERENFSMRLILASQSPRRADLLRAAGFEFEVCASDVDETVHGNEMPADYVRRLASGKSAVVLAGLAARAGVRTCAGDVSRPTAIVLGADTAVVVDGLILGKPANDDEGAAMLRRLSGRSHEVMTGLSIRDGARELRHVETTAVHFVALSDQDIDWYVRSGEGRDKAGAYAIQGLASRFIPRIAGSYSNVVGLPVAAVCALIRQLDTDGTP